MRLVILGSISVALLSACEADDWGPDRLRQGHSDQRVQELRAGHQVYANYCAGCHGEAGDGNGQAARFLAPKPRNFSVGRLKFAAVEAGQSPRDEDYLRIIENGLSGTAMPAFPFLSNDEKRSLVAYIKTFYPDWVDDPPGSPVSPGQDPWGTDYAGAIAEGKKAYYGVAKCWSCHPAYETKAEITRLHEEQQLPAPDLRADLYESTEKESNWGAPIRAPDFLQDRIKTGFEIESLARVIAAGVGGTAMPTWAGALEPNQIWGIAYYVHDLALKRNTPEAKALKTSLLSQN